MKTALSILYPNLALILFCVTNAYVDAYKIKLALKENLAKAIKHGINFVAYALATGLCIWLFHMRLWLAVDYAVCAFFCRQIWFDIPLNCRRGLPWDYVSLDRPPKAITDRIEVAIFGYNGRAPTVVYGVFWLVTLTVQYFV